LFSFDYAKVNRLPEKMLALKGSFYPRESGADAENSSKETAISQLAVNGTFSQYAFYEPIQRRPGVYCSATTKGGYDCRYEAEWSINGNLYCESCFKAQAKFLQDNSTGLKRKEAL
jgi:hypothetical protein